MLPDKPWRWNALLRLAGGLILCLFGASTVTAVIAYFEAPQPPNAVLFFGADILALVFFGLAAATLSGSWDFEEMPKKLLLFGGGFYGGFLLMYWAQHMLGKTVEAEPVSTARTVGGTLFVEIAWLALLVRFVHEHQMSWVDAFGLKERVPQAVVCGIVGVLIALPIGITLQWLSGRLMERVGLHPTEEVAVKSAEAASTLAAQLLFGMITIVCAPVVEESLFRGLLYPAIRRAGHPRLALWGTALLFGIMHGNAVALLSLVFLGLVLAILYERTGNLLAPMLTHSLFNAINFVEIVRQGPVHGEAFLRALHP
jgi:membrane protease YdiL (CAAX protease family)